MLADRLDFWNHPQWLNSSRDNPRDPNFEPFWMRESINQKSKQVHLTDVSKVPAFTGTEAYIPNYDCIIQWSSPSGRILNVHAERGKRTFRPEGMTKFVAHTGADPRFFVLKEADKVDADKA